MTNIVQQGTSLGSYPTSLSLKPHYKKDLASNHIWWETAINILLYVIYSSTFVALSIGIRIRWLYILQWGKKPPSKAVLGMINLHLMVRLQFWRTGWCGVPLHCHYCLTTLSGSTCHGPVTGWNRPVYKLSVLYKNTRYHTIMYKI